MKILFPSGYWTKFIEQTHFGKLKWHSETLHKKIEIQKLWLQKIKRLCTLDKIRTQFIHISPGWPFLFFDEKNVVKICKNLNLFNILKIKNLEIRNLYLIIKSIKKNPCFKFPWKVILNIKNSFQRGSAPESTVDEIDQLIKDKI